MKKERKPNKLKEVFDAINKLGVIIDSIETDISGTRIGIFIPGSAKVIRSDNAYILDFND